MFKEISNFPGYYVSNNGRVKHNDIYLTIGKFNTGYARTVLCVNGKATSKGVHRLVAEAFIPNPEGKPQVNHKDGNKLNNCVANLEWVTPKENMQHAKRLGLHSFYNKYKVQCVETGEVFESCKAAAISCGGKDGNVIARHLKGQLRSAYKKRWKRID